jgi:adenine-specific DNA-methyltransferase
MAYLKQWAPRSYQPLTLRVPALLPGSGRALHGDATAVVDELPEVDLAYLDPPYNQHRYFTNYHVWETLVAWDAPAHYGVACKRVDARDPATKSVFNDRRRAPDALARLIETVRAKVVVISASNEGWVTLDELVAMARPRGAVGVLAFDSRRYVGAQIGIHNPQGKKVGRVGSTRNTEYVIVAGEADLVARLTDGYPELPARQEVRRRSAGQKTEPDAAIRVVDVGVDQDHPLPGAESQPAGQDGEAERGADQDREQVVGTVAGGSVTMPVPLVTGEEPPQHVA